MARTLEVCLSPSLIPHYEIDGRIVVVIDIFRATSSICFGFENGAIEIIPVATVEECKSYEGQDYLLAAERNGEVVNGFNFGNSPFSYTEEKVKGRKVVLTTTNGTHAINQAKNADKIVIGSFLNLNSLATWLKNENNDVLLLCSGWKNKFNLEDTLFAGAIVQQLRTDIENFCDAAIAAEDLYLKAKEEGLRKYLYKSSHTQRLNELNIEDDIQFCLKQNICTVIPILKGNKLIPMKYL
jgi:2-phosphosulfolactate phosphatase